MLHCHCCCDVLRCCVFFRCNVALSFAIVVTCDSMQRDFARCMMLWSHALFSHDALEMVRSQTSPFLISLQILLHSCHSLRLSTQKKRLHKLPKRLKEHFCIMHHTSGSLAPALPDRSKLRRDSRMWMSRRFKPSTRSQQHNS